MDIQYLLFLQNLREATGGLFDEFFNALSKFTVDILPFLPYVVFWCISKKWGYRFMATTWLGEVLNGVIKLTVCAYRPWIRSSEINPAGDSKKPRRATHSQAVIRCAQRECTVQQLCGSIKKGVGFRFCVW